MLVADDEDGRHSPVLPGKQRNMIGLISPVPENLDHLWPLELAELVIEIACLLLAF